MQVRYFAVPVALWLATLISSSAASAADPVQIRVCPSQAKIEQSIQSQGKLLPDDCRTLTVTRVDSPAGPLCVLDLSGDNAGILGTLRDAVATTQWWATCASLHAP